MPASRSGAGLGLDQLDDLGRGLLDQARRRDRRRPAPAGQADGSGGGQTQDGTTTRRAAAPIAPEDGERRQEVLAHQREVVAPVELGRAGRSSRASGG